MIGPIDDEVVREIVKFSHNPLHWNDINNDTIELDEKHVILVDSYLIAYTLDYKFDSSKRKVGPLPLRHLTILTPEFADDKETKELINRLTHMFEFRDCSIVITDNIIHVLERLFD